jgi:antitoxin component YwqK of YwqJK toxin-antitoxin module
MKHLLLLLLATITLSAQAQKQQKIYYVNSKGKFVADLDSALYIRIIQEPDSGSNLYSLKEFYKNERRKRVGMVTQFNPSPSFEGSVISFFENGAKESVETYLYGVRNGDCYYYYPNGTLKEFVKYDYLTASIKTINVSDSLGNPFLDEKGNGRVLISTKETEESGNYKKGFKDGIWITKDLINNCVYTETYSSGTLKKGELIDNLGNKNTYSKHIVQPYLLHKKGFNIFNIHNIVFFRHIDSVGRVALILDIDKFGNPQNINVFKSLSQKSDAFAIETIKKLLWKPKIYRGKPVETISAFCFVDFR